MSDTEGTSSIREDVAAAMAAHSEGAEETPAPAAPEPVEAAPEPKEEAPEAKPAEAAAPKERAGRDATGRFAKAPKAAKTVTPTPRAEATPTDAPAKAAATATAQPLGATPTPTAEPVKAPQSWKPAAREEWAKVPPAVQAEVQRREKEVAQALQESVEHRRTAEGFKQVVSPFEAMIRAEGADPLRAVGNLLQTAAALRTAPPAQKAALIASIIQTHGVDPGLVGAHLQGQPVPQQQGQQFRDPRFDEFLGQLEAQKAQRAKATQEKHAADVQAFAAKQEFFEDVREDMADILEVAQRRGISLSLEDAYNRACKLHPEISGVLEQREKAKQANAQVASTQRSRAAASSIRSQPSGATPAPQSGGGIRDDIAAALAAARER